MYIPPLSQLFSLTQATEPSTHQKLEGTQLRGLDAENFSLKAQEVLDRFYKTPMPTYNEIRITTLSGSSAKWAELSRDEQQKIIAAKRRGRGTAVVFPYPGPKELESVVPRWVHGVPHACQAAIAVRAVAKLYQKYQPDLHIAESDIVLAQYLTLFHDSAREAEGVDLWDEQSAENARSYLLEHGLGQGQADACIRAISGKDEPLANKTSISKMIHDGDCVDITRVYGSEFDPTCTDIYQELKDIPGFLLDYRDLIRDHHKFSNMTRSAPMRAHIERAPNAFGLIENLALQLPKYKELIGGEPQLPASTRLLLKADHKDFDGQYFQLEQIGGIDRSKGFHRSYLLSDLFGQLFFWKLGEPITIASETAASSLANRITGGLVPVANPATYRGETGSIQKFRDLSRADFAAPFDPSRLSRMQKEQVIVHMIADHIISNIDTHTGQFGTDAAGNVIGFDKGQAYRFFYSLDNRAFSGEERWGSVGTNEPTYQVFANYIKVTGETASLLKSSAVQLCLGRVKELSREDLREALSEYSKQRNRLDHTEPDRLINDVAARAHRIERELWEYFVG